MNNENIIRTWQFKFAVFASIQFVVMTVIAMVIYPGVDSQVSHYQFFKNYFSSLGMTVTSGGKTNIISAVLFMITMAVAGAGIVLFFMGKQQLFRRKKRMYLISWTGSFFGIISGILYAGTAFLPYNLMPVFHLYIVVIAFCSLLGAVIIYTAIIFLTSDYPGSYAILDLVFALLLAGFIILLLCGPRFDSAEGVYIQATGQKIIVYAAIIYILLQSYRALKYIKQIS